MSKRVIDNRTPPVSFESFLDAHNLTLVITLENKCAHAYIEDSNGQKAWYLEDGYDGPKWAYKFTGGEDTIEANVKEAISGQVLKFGIFTWATRLQVPELT